MLKCESCNFLDLKFKIISGLFCLQPGDKTMRCFKILKILLRFLYVFKIDNVDMEWGNDCETLSSLKLIVSGFLTVSVHCKLSLLPPPECSKTFHNSLKCSLQTCNRNIKVSI